MFFGGEHSSAHNKEYVKTLGGGGVVPTLSQGASQRQREGTEAFGQPGWGEFMAISNADILF